MQAMAIAHRNIERRIAPSINLTLNRQLVNRHQQHDLACLIAFEPFVGDAWRVIRNAATTR
jgi:hypothetical protein